MPERMEVTRTTEERDGFQVYQVDIERRGTTTPHNYTLPELDREITRQHFTVAYLNSELQLREFEGNADRVSELNTDIETTGRQTEDLEYARTMIRTAPE